jgi:hydrogenase nickel incorporation protein HypA/HybF
MHEFSLVQGLLGQVDVLRREQQAERVVSIQVSVGEFSGVEPELFRRAYETLIEETAMRGAELQINRVPLESRCDNCRHDFAVERFRFRCPKCKSTAVTIVNGEGLVLASVTVEQAESVGTDP